MIIDCHTHWGMCYEDRDHGDPAHWLSVLDNHGVNRAFLLGHYNLHRLDRCQTDNDRLADLTARFPDRFVPFGSV